MWARWDQLEVWTSTVPCPPSTTRPVLSSSTTTTSLKTWYALLVPSTWCLPFRTVQDVVERVWSDCTNKPSTAWFGLLAVQMLLSGSVQFVPTPPSAARGNTHDSRQYRVMSWLLCAINMVIVHGYSTRLKYTVTVHGHSTRLVCATHMHVMEAGKKQSKLTDKMDTAWYLIQTCQLHYAQLFPRGPNHLQPFQMWSRHLDTLCRWMCSIGHVHCYNVQRVPQAWHA